MPVLTKPAVQVWNPVDATSNPRGSDMSDEQRWGMEIEEAVDFGGKIAGLVFSDVALLLASSKPAQGVGSIWQAGQFFYREASASSIDFDILTSPGGVKLYKLQSEPIPDKIYNAAIQMFLGAAVNIDCFGDSTMVGIDAANGPSFVAATPSPAKLQLFLRDYFNNNLITVSNRGISGTRSSQMLDGTDTSGLTFEARIASSTASIIYCNHGINDCQNTPPTQINTYVQNLIKIIEIIRKYDKIPILMTPNLISPIPALGTTNKTERLRTYAEAVRAVCRQYNVTLIDAFEQTEKLLSCGQFSVQQILPDGIHPTQITYTHIGQLMAEPFVYPHKGLSRNNQILSPAMPGFLCHPISAASEAKNTKSGMQLVSAAANEPKSIKIVVKINEPNLDLYLAYPVWNGGAVTVGVSLDQTAMPSISQFHAGNYSTRYIQDHEICIARNVTPGLHIVTMSAVGQAASIGVNYLRVKNNKLSARAINGTPFFETKTTLIEEARLVVSNGNLNAVALDDAIQIDRYSGKVDLSWTANMAKGEAVCLLGQIASDFGPGSKIAVMALGVGLDISTGFLTIFQTTGDGTFTTTALNAVDTSGLLREWRVVINQGLGSLINVFVDANAYTPQAINSAFLGGMVGLRRSGNGTITIKNISLTQ